MPCALCAAHPQICVHCSTASTLHIVYKGVGAPSYSRWHAPRPYYKPACCCGYGTFPGQQPQHIHTQEQQSTSGTVLSRRRCCGNCKETRGLCKTACCGRRYVRRNPGHKQPAESIGWYTQHKPNNLHKQRIHKLYAAWLESAA